MALGVIIRKARRDKDLTIKQAADDLNIAASHLHAIERGNKPRPKMDIIYKLCAYYNIDSDSACLAATRIPSDVFFKIVRHPELLQVIRDHPE